MKRMIAIGALAAVVMVLAFAGTAGAAAYVPYHKGTSLVCSD